LGGAGADLLRNGADAWLRWAFEVAGLRGVLAVPAVVAGVLVLWSAWRWGDRPHDCLGVCLGMAIESVLFALGLWALSRNFGAILDRLGVELSAGAPAEAAGRFLTYVGAGIYEEVLFRLILFAGLAAVLRFCRLPALLAVAVAAVASALLFAAAHHLGPYGEPMDGYAFLFRTCAGVYFALLFQGRGIGVAVGSHAAYDVLVGLPAAGV
ncbi:MAG TPA: CPBP family glutamic-type intramembrane protease, partial [Gemmataceae bacterium]